VLLAAFVKARSISFAHSPFTVTLIFTRKRNSEATINLRYATFSADRCSVLCKLTTKGLKRLHTLGQQRHYSPPLKQASTTVYVDAVSGLSGLSLGLSTFADNLFAVLLLGPTFSFRLTDLDRYHTIVTRHAWLTQVTHFTIVISDLSVGSETFILFIPPQQPSTCCQLLC